MIDQIEKLFGRQTQAWPLLARGIDGLAQARTRAARIDWFEVFIRHIPHRLGSTTAAVEPASVARRPCFLCSGNLPPEEEGLPFGSHFTIYCNPFPIVERHLTIVHQEHRPQRLAGHLRTMLDFAASLPGYFVVYNGPQCGASAPDHLHFQAGLRRLFPIEHDTAGLLGPTVPRYERNVLLFRAGDRSALIARLECAVELLAEATRQPIEPMVNLALWHERGEWVMYLFPRGKHRPAAFHRGELMVSPAAIDLSGIFVVPRAQDFETITGEAVAAIFREVTLPDAQFHAVAEKLESGW